MKLISAAIVAAAVAAIAAPAAASPAFDAFRKVCGDSQADFAVIKTALAAPGWSPAEVQPTNMQNVTVQESIARATVVGDARVTVFAWIGAKGAVHVTACTAKVAKGNLADLTRESQAWIGFAPVSAAGKSTWRYGVTGGARTVVQAAGYEAAAAGGGLFFFNVFSEGDQVVLDMLKIKS